MSEFVGFKKLHRLSKPVIITEKLDGTNAQVFITDEMEVYAGSRNRFLTVEKDNFGFARWVEDNKEELLELGPGRHFGEWWGKGIQRGYGLEERRFSLFNVSRWSEESERPSCCHVVPILSMHDRLDTESIQSTLDDLKALGSMAAPGFMNPEGIVVYQPSSNYIFKKTFEYDETGKGNNR